MTGPRQDRNVAGRALTVAVQALPEHRREWAQAMSAELAVIEGARARARFVIGCARAVLAEPGARWTMLSFVAAAAMTVMCVLLARVARLPWVRVEMLVLMAVLGICYWLSRRQGPVADGRTARLVRGVGGAVLAVALLAFYLPPGPKGEGWWLAAAAIALDWWALLHVTGRVAAVGPRYLRTGLLVAVVGSSAWWVTMLLFSGVRDQPGWLPLCIGLIVVVGAGSQARLGDFRQAFLGALGAGAASCVLIFLAAVGTYAAFPQLVPDISGNTCCAGGLTRADRAETNRVESTDPYVAELLLGGLLAAVLAASGASTALGRSSPGSGRQS